MNPYGGTNHRIIYILKKAAFNKQLFVKIDIFYSTLNQLFVIPIFAYFNKIDGFFILRF